jgi:hypothetical protein
MSTSAAAGPGDSTTGSTSTEPKGMSRLWRDFNLTIVAGILFLATFAAFAIVDYHHYEHEAHVHRFKTTFSGWMSEFWTLTLENWQSEFLHITLFVLLTAFLVHKGSAESRDSDDRVEEGLERIEERLARLEQGLGRRDG